MFKCEKCNYQSKSGEKANYLFHYRKKEYTNLITLKNKKKIKKDSIGREIDKQYIICVNCLEDKGND